MQKNIGVKIGLGVLGVVVAGIIVATATLVGVESSKNEGSEPKELATYDEVKEAAEALQAELTLDDVNVIEDWELVDGNLATAKVVVVEYADYECSACAYYSSAIDELMKEFDSNDVAWVFRPYVLSYHEHGIAAAAAAEAANQQGCWPAFKRMLFDQQETWTEMTENRFIKTLDSYFEVACPDKDPKKFHDDFYDIKTPAKLATTMAYGKMIAISGTPSFYVNGEAVDAPKVPETISSLLGY